jgi:hypothetical protein
MLSEMAEFSVFWELAYPTEMPRSALLNNGIVEVTGSIPVGSTN